jgi:hypothetical protein
VSASWAPGSLVDLDFRTQQEKRVWVEIPATGDKVRTERSEDELGEGRIITHRNRRMT